jgi:hypothetical protein
VPILLETGCSLSLRLRPISNAAIIEMALASPMPLNLQSSTTVSFASAFKSLLQECKIRLLNSTAVSVVEPEPIKIAINSASVKVLLPLSK